MRGRIMRFLTIIFALLLSVCGCSGDAQTVTQLQANPSTASVTATMTPATPAVSQTLTPTKTLAPTPSAKPTDELSFLESISPALRAMVVEDYPWDHEYHEELIFHEDMLLFSNRLGNNDKLIDEVPPFSMQLENNDKPPFSREDMVAGEPWYDVPLTEVLASMGMPRAAYYYIIPATGEECLALYYASGEELTFYNVSREGYDYRLNSARIVNDFPGPRGIQVGDSVDTVIQAFKVDPPDLGESNNIPGCMMLYAEHLIYDEYDGGMRALAPSGTFESGGYYHWDDPSDSKSYIRYDCPVYPYVMEELTSGKKEYPFMAMYYLSFVIRDDRVIEFFWSMGAGAE